MIRRLTESDFSIYRDIRLEALKLHPESFGSADEEAGSEKQEATYRRWLSGCVFGCFDEERLIGVAGFYIHQGIRSCHRGSMFSVYVKPHYRARGYGDALVKTIIDHAKQHVVQLHCSVVDTNEAAIKNYKRNGFEIYGTDPRVFKLGDTYIGEYLMVRKFS